MDAIIKTLESLLDDVNYARNLERAADVDRAEDELENFMRANAADILDALKAARDPSLVYEDLDQALNTIFQYQNNNDPFDIERIKKSMIATLEFLDPQRFAEGD